MPRGGQAPPARLGVLRRERRLLATRSSSRQRRAAIPRTFTEREQQTELGLLIAVDDHDESWAIQDSLEELARLAESVDVEVVGSVVQKLPHPLASTYVGKGKLEEIKNLREELEYDVVIVDDELSPAQLRNLEKELDVKI